MQPDPISGRRSAASLARVGKRRLNRKLRDTE
jgi:hypothetical protein